MCMPRDDYEGFFDQLTPAEIDAHGLFLQVLEMMRSSGKTMKDLAADQRRFVEEIVKTAEDTLAPALAQ